MKTELLDIEAAKAKGAMMLFGEKYGDEVRVLSMGSVIDEKLLNRTLWRYSRKTYR